MLATELKLKTYDSRGKKWREKWGEIHKIGWHKNKLVKKEMQRHKNAIQKSE